MSIARGCTIRLPINRPATAVFSANASASARIAYNAGPGFGFAAFRCASSASMITGLPTVANGRVQLRRIESATAIRIGDAGVIRCCSIPLRKISKSSTVTRPPAPVPATPAKSDAFNPNSNIRARSLGEIYDAPVAPAGTGNPPTTGSTVGCRSRIASSSLN